MDTVANHPPTNPVFLSFDQAVAVVEPPIENPSASKWSLSHGKRLFDISVALLVLALLALPMLAIAIGVRLTSKGPALFVQNRVGRGGCLFGVYKFRSMAVGGSPGSGLTRDGDQRITVFGRWMRRFKLDELPQLYNILRGEMSLVGPRPKLPQYEGISKMPYRPGITGASTLAFRREEKILSNVHPSQLDFFYDQQIKPFKVRIDVCYMSRATFWTDIRIIAATLLVCVIPERILNALRRYWTQAQSFETRVVAAGRGSKASAESVPGGECCVDECPPHGFAMVVSQVESKPSPILPRKTVSKQPCQIVSMCALDHRQRKDFGCMPTQ